VLEPIVLQLGLAVSALFTTSEALRQTILEVGKQPKLILELREEINEAISRYGWTAKALFEMRLLDSVMKEAQRTLPILGTLLRVVSSDIY
jgi:cytochrome P450